MKRNNIKPTILLYLFLGIASIICLSGCASQAKMRSIAGSDENSNARSETNEIASASANVVPIVNITTSTRSVSTNEEITISASAIDPAGGKVFLTWQASEGTITDQTDSTIKWKAPLYGTNAILNCSASDTRGKTASASIEVSVVGSINWQIKILGDKSSLYIDSDSNTINDYVPLKGAKVMLVGTDISAYTDSRGIVDFNIDHSYIYDTSKIRITYQNWDLTYETTLAKDKETNRSDEIMFSPGYAGITIAKASGDSFLMKRGMFEIAPVENISGKVQPVKEVTISAGGITTQNDTIDGKALIAVNSNTKLTLDKAGYQTIESYAVSADSAYATLIQAQLTPYTQLSSRPEPYISYFKPGNLAKNIALSTPITVGFAQPMTKETILNDFEAIIYNKSTGAYTGITSSNISGMFQTEWKDEMTLQLTPNSSFAPDTTYAIEIKKWNAFAADGRSLKNYSGLYRQFTTVGDPVPHILSYSPANNDTGISRSGPLSLTFDTIMDPETFKNDLKITIENRSDVKTTDLTADNIEDYVSIIWKDDNKTVEFVPKTPLSPHATYVAKIIKLGVKSTAGKTVTGINNTWISFTTGGF